MTPGHDGERRPRRALLSVADKTGLVELARGLAAFGIELCSTGGSAKTLREAECAVREVADLTGFPEVLDGRVKTLHPVIHGGILARRDDPAHVQALATHGIAPIDLVVVNLYPFERTVARAESTPAETVEQIDVGGVALIRAAAKNHDGVAVLVDPGQYASVLQELSSRGGTLTAETRRRLAREAFLRTAAYDAAIATWLDRTSPAATEEARWPLTLRLDAERVECLRYGENPHQAAAFYRPLAPSAGADGGPFGLGAARRRQGPELSYNNLLDASAALGLLGEFDEPAAVVVKHGNPCGAATGPDVSTAFARARASDPVSIYGGVVAVNRPVDGSLVEAMAGVLLELLLAPDYAPDVLETLGRTKRKLRVLEAPVDRRRWPPRLREARSVLGGFLLQEADLADLDLAACTVPTRRRPTEAEWRGLRFAWRVAKHVKSNAIVLTSSGQVLGVGAGQMSRVDAARLAVARAREYGHALAGACAASDAFFPFRDGFDVVAEAGATAVIHPGGSIRDAEVIEVADEREIAMVLTGLRHFKH